MKRTTVPVAAMNLDVGVTDLEVSDAMPTEFDLRLEWDAALSQPVGNCVFSTARRGKDAIYDALCGRLTHFVCRLVGCVPGVIADGAAKPASIVQNTALELADWLSAVVTRNDDGGPHLPGLLPDPANRSTLGRAVFGWTAWEHTKRLTAHLAAALLLAVSQTSRSAAKRIGAGRRARLAAPVMVGGLELTSTYRADASLSSTLSLLSCIRRVVAQDGAEARAADLGRIDFVFLAASIASIRKHRTTPGKTVAPSGWRLLLSRQHPISLLGPCEMRPPDRMWLPRQTKYSTDFQFWQSAGMVAK